MFEAASRIPVTMHKGIALALAMVAMILALLGSVGVGDFFEKTKTSGHLMWKHTEARSLGDRMPSLIGGLAALVIAILCVLAALWLLTMQGRLKKYPPILTGVESIKVHRIAAITNSSTSRVYRDIQGLIDSGVIDDFYIDYQGEQVVSTKYLPKSSHKTVVSCGACGANNEVIVGITQPCRSCGEPVLLGTTGSAGSRWD